MMGGEALTWDRPMGPYTTFQVGGHAEAVFEAADLKGLLTFVAGLYDQKIPYLVIGNGSNILIRDGGINGVVIRLTGSLAAIQEHGKRDGRVTAGGGVPIKALLLMCQHHGLGGLEFLAGIPGSLGGAVAMNAGAFGDQMGDRVEEIRGVTPQGDRMALRKQELTYAYRTLELAPGTIITHVRLRLDLDDTKAVSRRIARNLRQKNRLQPLHYPSAGSVFKNPVDDYAGRLIEAVGLKGKRVAGAMVSEKHANYIVNTGGAAASDILALMKLIQQEVKHRTGVDLKPEIRIVGEER